MEKAEEAKAADSLVANGKDLQISNNNISILHLKVSSTFTYFSYCMWIKINLKFTITVYKEIALQNAQSSRVFWIWG